MLNENNLLLDLISKECSEQFHTTFSSLLSMKLQTDPWEIKDSILNLYIAHLNTNQVKGIDNIFILFAFFLLYCGTKRAIACGVQHPFSLTRKIT